MLFSILLQSDIFISFYGHVLNLQQISHIKFHLLKHFEDTHFSPSNQMIETTDNFELIEGGYDYLVDFSGDEPTFPTKRPQREHNYLEVCNYLEVHNYLEGGIIELTNNCETYSKMFGLISFFLGICIFTNVKGKLLFHQFLNFRFGLILAILIFNNVDHKNFWRILKSK